jgi:hypothetical protein
VHGEQARAEVRGHRCDDNIVDPGGFDDTRNPLPHSYIVNFGRAL